ncbi:TPA: hypothetical protein HA338_11995 [Methanosarcina acetivorans]|uniref:Uncharacterized protein n=1 Tax=Methanosarcina acetivorans TaxID=2214 RepID=A0A832SKE8_9EURY|nr:hypothetical protein [Methanosarcina acetivorans]HIH94702.1 hypothetical protein [Methanosarcina acetivorans]
MKDYLPWAGGEKTAHQIRREDRHIINYFLTKYLKSKAAFYNIRLEKGPKNKKIPVPK